MKNVVKVSTKPKKSTLEGIFEKGQAFGTLTIEGVTYNVYLGPVEVHPIQNVRAEIVEYKHKFTLIEV